MLPHVTYTIRKLSTLAECWDVVALEKQVWGYTDYEDVVPAAILLVSVKRGGVLLGAFDSAHRMVGFAYALAALKDGQPTQWSHMLGVLPDARDAGLGAELKREQRRVALEMGITLIEWTFDPMQALNAHLNFAKLGVVAEEYVENVYGDSSSPLHRGNPTDRLIAQWKLDEPHVLRRLERRAVPMRDVGAFDAPAALRIDGSTGPTPGHVATALEERRLSIEIPVGFSDMLTSDPQRALAWRHATREAFSAYLSRGYRVVDFFLEREKNRGRYLLSLA
jgi:predicted GNAT superfamily acetyltransferase